MLNFFAQTLLYQIILSRWLVRSAYGIGDIKSCWTDCCLSCCCPCCVVNQLYHQTTSRRNPTVDGGYQYNNDPMSSVKDSHFVETVIRCLFSTCLLPCEIGRTMEAAMGMPYFLGCCCMGFFAARNIVRYHYRLKRSFAESDVAEECIWPMCLHSLGIIVVPVLPCLWSKLCICIYPALAMELAREVEIKTAGGKSHAGYLVGYHPPLPHSAAPVSMEISPQKF